MLPFQSWIFVPGQRQSMLDKAQGFDADALIFDLEDSVPPAEKTTARQQINAALDQPQSQAVRYVRTHSARSPELKADLEAVVRPGLDGILLPKVDDPAEITTLAASLDSSEKKAGIPSGHIRLLALIESARGLVTAPAIAAADTRLIGLMFGAEDFAQDLGLPAIDSDSAEHLLYARSAVVVAAASAGLQAVDSVYLNFRDKAGLVAATRRARQLGFSGKGLIHPDQLEPTHAAFQPSTAEVNHARHILDGFAAAEKKGDGAFVLDGRMVDLPIVERARRTLALFERRGAQPQ